MSDSSILEYARYHGLAINYQDLDLLSDIRALRKVDDVDADEADLQDFVPPKGHAAVLTEPELQVTKESMLLLAACQKRPPSPDWQTMLPDPQRRRRLKLEPPVLMTDHERDMRKFRPRVDIAELLNDVTELEAFTWAEEHDLEDIHTFEAAREDVMQELRTERLQTTKEAILYLQEALRHDWSDDLWEVLRPPKTTASKPLSEPLSPPLHPMSQSPEPEPDVTTSYDTATTGASAPCVDLDSIFRQVKQECRERDVMEQDSPLLEVDQISDLFREGTVRKNWV